MCAYSAGTYHGGIRIGLLLALGTAHLIADSTGTLTGRVTDPSDRAVAGASVMVRNSATLIESSVTTNGEGLFEIPALSGGTYRMEIKAGGFRAYVVPTLTMDVARTVVRDVRLEIGDVSEEVTVTSPAPPVDRATTSVGHVIDQRTVQETPLNGRYFLDLALLAPGSVTPSQNGFNTTPSRGLGAFSINTAGNREDTVNYVINGITINDLLFNGIMFQPSISTVEEFKIDNSTLSSEYGHSSGGVVNVATRSGTQQFHGELFEFLRNDGLDARNFFDFASSEARPFKRNQFGGALGGPIIQGKTFFFVSYEGLRLLQQVNLNSLVLSDAQRNAAGDETVRKLIPLIPFANFIDSTGAPRYVGSAAAPVNGDQGGIDVTHILDESDRLHAFYSLYRTRTIEPGSRGTTIPGFGTIQTAQRQFFSLNYTHIFGFGINEAHFGVNRQSSSTQTAAQLNPVDFDIRDGISQATGLPQISIGGGALSFGGPSPYPSGRGDTTFVAGDTVGCLCGRHSLKFGGEYREFLNNNFRSGSGAINFPSVSAFLADTANSFSVTLGNQSSAIEQGTIGGFLQDNYKWRPNLTLELGLRYDWNMTPSERYGRFIVFNPNSASIERIGSDGEIYHQNNRNVQPRVGLAWDPFKDGRTSVRVAYGLLVDQPITNVVVGTAGNPPLAIPLTFAGTIGLNNATDLARASGLAPATVAPAFDNARLQSWNLNLQREVLPGLAVMAGYFGSKATHLILSRNINQPTDGVRPFPAVSQSSPILPGTPLGNITQMESTGNSSYNALWVSASKPLARGLQVHASYTWSKSLDYNSLSSQGVVVQNSYDLQDDRGLSDFQARHRLVIRAIYDLPLQGSRFVTGWQVAILLVGQSGNPVNIVTPTSTLTGVANTVRPDVTGPIPIIGSTNRWFDTSIFTPAAGFGNLGRNVVIGPSFNNADFSIIKDTALTEKTRMQFRVEVFDLFNHANLGQPGNVVGSPSFGVITNTRFPTGESGSSRQVQFGIRVMV